MRSGRRKGQKASASKCTLVPTRSARRRHTELLPAPGGPVMTATIASTASHVVDGDDHLLVRLARADRDTACDVQAFDETLGLSVRALQHDLQLDRPVVG